MQTSALPEAKLPTLEEIAGTFDEPVTAEQVEDALYAVQKLEPAGVGARDLQECLLLQVNADTPHHDLVKRMIEEHLEDIPHNRLPAIERKSRLAGMVERLYFDPAQIRAHADVLHVAAHAFLDRAVDTGRSSDARFDRLVAARDFSRAFQF